MTEHINTVPARAVKAPARRARWHAIALGSLAMAAMSLGAMPTSARAAVYLGAPVYGYPPPPVVYAPGPVYVAPYPPPAPVYVAPPPVVATNCRPYQTNATVGGVPTRVTGTACRQPDGSWVAVH